MSGLPCLCERTFVHFYYFWLMMTWLLFVWTNFLKVCTQDLVHKWRGFMIKEKSVEFSPEEKLCSALGPVPSRIPGRTVRPQTGSPGAQWTGSLASCLVQGRIFRGPPDHPACNSASPNLRPNIAMSCFQRPDFHPHINTPSPSWGRVRTSPTIVRLWISHLPSLQKHQIP
jgi:hypothetical protein